MKWGHRKAYQKYDMKFQKKWVRNQNGRQH